MTDVAAPTIGGTVEPGFEAVRDAFVRNFTEHGELGAGVAVHVNGKKVVDLWGGVADPATGRAYDDRTLQLVFSTTKGATAVCVALLAQRGEIDYDAKVADYWPEFAAEGKGEIPVHVLMSHRAGLPVIDRTLTADEVFAWTPVIEALAAQAPVWEPGTKHGYHAVTYGHLAGELVRRVSGKSLGTFFADEVAKPLGLDFWIGLPASQESARRSARAVTTAAARDGGDHGAVHGPRQPGGPRAVARRRARRERGKHDLQHACDARG